MANTTRTCEVIWDVPTADRAQELVELSIGGPCPCTAGRECPLLPLRRDGAKVGNTPLTLLPGQRLTA